MSCKYRMKPKTDSTQDIAVQKYYATAVSRGVINMRMLAKDIVQRTSLTEGDVMATLISLAEAIEERLHQGYNVKLDRIGTFSLSATSDGYDNPNDCKPRNVKAKRICYLADIDLRKNLKYVKFERDK